MEIAVKKPRWALRALVGTAAIGGLYAAGLGVQAGFIEYVQRCKSCRGAEAILALGAHLRCTPGWVPQGPIAAADMAWRLHTAYDRRASPGTPREAGRQRQPEPQ